MIINSVEKYTYRAAACFFAACFLFMLNVMLDIDKIYIAALILVLISVGCNIYAYIYETRTEGVKFALLSTDAMLPEKRAEDAGYDIYACFEQNWIRINPNETTMIPTGIVSAFNNRYVAVLKERGSTGTKGIGQRCGVIDSGFRGEWMVPITNHNDKPIVILKSMYKDNWLELIGRDGHDESDYIVYPYDKAICQMLLLPVPKVRIKEVSLNDVHREKSERGTGLLGSSGK